MRRQSEMKLQKNFLNMNKQPGMCNKILESFINKNSSLFVNTYCDT
jgi:hypothetical protein